MGEPIFEHEVDKFLPNLEDVNEMEAMRMRMRSFYDRLDDEAKKEFDSLTAIYIGAFHDGIKETMNALNEESDVKLSVTVRN